MVVSRSMTESGTSTALYAVLAVPWKSASSRRPPPASAPSADVWVVARREPAASLARFPSCVGER